MSRRKDDLPIMIGSGLGKGVMITRSTIMRGFDMYILWLNGEHEKGASFELEEIRKVDHVIHFCDRESVEQAIEILKTMLKMWGGEKRGRKAKEA